MEKNKKMYILFAILIVANFGISLAYFSGVTRFDGDGSTTRIKTAKIDRSTLTMEGILNTSNIDIYPGHRNITMLKVKGKSLEDKDLVAYNLVWNGTNEFKTDFNYNVYKVDSEKNAHINCIKKEEMQGKSKIYYETCENINFAELGSVVSSGTINGDSENISITLLENEFMWTTTSEVEVYYYLVLEYPNLNYSQNEDIGKSFKGLLSIEASDVQDYPTVAIQVNSNTPGSNGWYNDVNLSITGSDIGNSSITNIKYCITSNETCTPDTLISNSSTTINLPNNASPEKVCAVAISNNGAESELVCSNTYKVDNGLPSIAYSVNDSTEGNNGWYKNLSINVNGTTSGSSITNINYCVTTSNDCTPDHSVNSSSTIVAMTNNADPQIICAVSTSESGKVGNKVCSSGYSVDGSLPSVSITGSTPTSNSITVNVSGTDSDSGVVAYHYSINNGLYQRSENTSYTFTGLDRGTQYTIKVKSEDSAGNISEEVTGTFETLNTYEGTIAYLCPDGTYQSTSTCTSSSLNYTISYHASCTSSTSCTITSSGNNGFNAIYSCNNGTATMTTCKYNGTTCTSTYMCTRTSGATAGTLKENCNSSLPSTGTHGGGMSSTSNCTCPKYYSNPTSSTTGSTSCASGYNPGSISKQCSVPSGTCSSAWNCTETITTSCTATGTKYYYCSATNTYQTSQTCNY